MTMTIHTETEAIANEVVPDGNEPPAEISGASSEVRAVHPPNRNGYATVVGHLGDLAANVQTDALRRKRTVLLTRDAEEQLRDGDQAQLGARGIALAKHGAKPAWRTFLGEHFRLKFDLILLYDAPALRVE